ncbi:MAG TPA: hypothetical protein VIH40_02110 [Xanthobacteraceae bacterium]
MTLLTGIAVLVITAVALAAMLPRGGRTHRFVGTELEPYVGVAFCAAIALGCTLLLSGALDLLGNP